jgi:hypothetical protein
MKKLLTLIVMAIFLSAAANAQTKKPATASSNIHNDNVDDRMKGPNGEKIYIGANGGRYYLSGNKKVYVKYNGKKKGKAGK